MARDKTLTSLMICYGTFLSFFCCNSHYVTIRKTGKKGRASYSVADSVNEMQISVLSAEMPRAIVDNFFIHFS